MWDKAVAYCRQAGEKALARSAYREAVGSFEQALSALPHLPEQRATREQAIDLRLALRSALRPLGDSGSILVRLHEAEVLAEDLDDSRRLGQVSGFLSIHFRRMGAYDQAIASGERARALARASGDLVLQALANQYLGTVYEHQGDYRRAIDCFGKTVALLEGPRRYERFGQAFLPAVFSRALLASCHAELGTFADGNVFGEEGLRIAEVVAQPANRMWAYYGIGLLSLRQGNLPRALSWLERAVGFCQDADLADYFPWTAAALGAAYTLGERVADAVPLLMQAMEQSTVMERVHFETLCSLSMEEAQLLAGHLEEAHALGEHTLVHAREHQERGNEAYALRLLGEIATRREPSETALAEAHYQQALALAEALGMRPLVAHCHRGLGMLYAKIGRRAKARAALSAAAEWYRAMEMMFWLPQAETALAEVEGH
jgi:tetratricopeptide (TPR) repeat protein